MKARQFIKMKTGRSVNGRGIDGIMDEYYDYAKNLMLFSFDVSMGKNSFMSINSAVEKINSDVNPVVLISEFTHIDREDNVRDISNNVRGFVQRNIELLCEDDSFLFGHLIDYSELVLSVVKVK